MPIAGGYADNIVFEGNVNTLGKPMKAELINCGKAFADNCEIVRKTD